MLEKVWVVYILKSENNSVYCGCTGNFTQRLHDHNNGKCHTTRKNKNWRPIWISEPLPRSVAFKFEKFVKRKGIRRFLLTQQPTNPTRYTDAIKQE